MGDEEEAGKKRAQIVGFFKQLVHEEKKEVKESGTAGGSGDAQELVLFFKKYGKYAWIIGLIIILALGWHSRTENLRNTTPGINGLIDVTTGKHVSVDLDSHVFFRLAKYIVEHGKIYDSDPLRYYPLGYRPYPIAPLSYIIAYLYKGWAFFDANVTIEYADVMYPVIAFAISQLFFFLLVSRLFSRKVALVATLLLAFLPAYLFRTMAGSSDHDAMGIMFMHITLYLYVVAWQQKQPWKAGLVGALTGVATMLTGVTWPGGVFPIYVIISLFVIGDIMLKKFMLKDFCVHWAWFLVTFFTLSPIYDGAFLSTDWLRHSSIGLLMLFALSASLANMALLQWNPLRIRERMEKVMPEGVFIILLLVVLGVLFLAASGGFFGLGEQIDYIRTNLLSPFANSRWQVTVAEQHQPYIVDWRGQMGGNWLYVGLFLIGAVYLFYELIKPLQKHKWALSGLFAFFLWAFIFSRYRDGSVLNGESGIARFLYIGSLIIFIGIMIGLYLYSFYRDKETYHRMAQLDTKYLFVFIWFFLTVVGARGAIRLLFTFSPVTAMLAAYAIVGIVAYGWQLRMKITDKVYRGLIYAALAVFILIVASPFNLPVRGEKGLIFDFYSESMSQAKWIGPAYNQQWQIAGQWIRENTPKDAVFAHWWDYGYWVQSGGERATITDGGNEIGPWNYLMGRMVLTGQNQTEALQFLKAHDASHLLIISDEIGKYTAYSSIGSDTAYDRYSWMTLFHLDETQTKETRDQTVLFFRGGQPIDEDFIFNGVTFRRQASAVGAVLLPLRQNEGGQVTFSQPTAIVVAYNQQYNVPMNCIFFQDRVIRFAGGWEGCLRIVPSLSGEQQNPLGAAYLISARAMRTLWVNLFMLNKQNPEYDTSAFELAYDDSRSWPLAVINGRAIGPLKVWKINYGNFTVSNEMREQYISREYVNPDAIKI
ncbi:glycosyltransferase family 39 protein [Candidatus Woesearchaeota archaeon]|nr:glycosyltransferase family 39 protein [Candidatus Woesearchaeota archaeon]